MKEKDRLDTILVRQGYYPSKEKAQAAIMAGLVRVNGEKAEKAGQRFNSDLTIDIAGNLSPFVSRGGLKLAKALTSFQINVKDKVCIDVGASTGGFTDCLLQNGARKVYAVDVGYGQLAWELRNDQRVIVMERTNIRFAQREWFSEQLQFAAIDVSFISLRIVIPPVMGVLLPGSELVCLIKPQFEVGKDLIGKKGVVKDPETHIKCLVELYSFFSSNNILLKNLTYSPVKGPQGNIEFLAHLVGTDTGIDPDPERLTFIHQVVSEAHIMLN